MKKLFAIFVICTLIGSAVAPAHAAGKPDFLVDADWLAE